MKIVLMSLMCCAGTFYIDAMEKWVPKEIGTGSGDVREYKRMQPIKDGSYLDVGYAVIPECTIDIHDATEADLLNDFILARVATSDTVHYYNARALHKTLKLQDSLPSLTTLKDPFDGQRAIQSITYYGYGMCTECEQCSTELDTTYKKMNHFKTYMNTSENENPSVAKILSMEFALNNACTSKSFSEKYTYEDLQKYPGLYMVDFGELKKGREWFEKNDVESKDIKAIGMVCVTVFNMLEGLHDASCKKYDEADEKLGKSETYTQKIVELSQLRLDLAIASLFLKEVPTFLKKVVEAERITNETEKKVYWTNYRKERQEMREERQKSAKDILNQLLKK